MTDASGNIVRSFGYNSFGGIISQTGYLNQPFAFAGREFDAESGLYYYRARYYDPRAGRFLTQDPIGFGGRDVNFYRYVGNNPTNLGDPEGLQPFGYKPFKKHEYVIEPEKVSGVAKAVLEAAIHALITVYTDLEWLSSEDFLNKISDIIKYGGYGYAEASELEGEKGVCK